MSVGKRLRQALEKRGMSVRAFHREMSERKVPGSSYPTIHRYLKDATTPSVEFLRAASVLLEIRESWLISGEGAPTPEEELAQEELKRVQRSVLEGEDLDLWERTVKEVPQLADLATSVQMVITDSWVRRSKFLLALRYPEDVRESISSQTPWAEGIADELLAPFERLGVHPTVDSEEFTDYAMAMIHALNLALKVPFEPEDA